MFIVLAFVMLYILVILAIKIFGDPIRKEKSSKKRLPAAGDWITLSLYKPGPGSERSEDQEKDYEIAVPPLVYKP